MGLGATRTTPSIAATGSWQAWAALVRIDRAIGAALYVLVGAYLAVDATALTDPHVLRAVAVVGFVVAFGFALNDCCDVEVDALGRPDRPLPSGRIPHRAAARLSAGLAGAALAVSATLGPRLALFALATVGLSAAYSFRLKDTLLAGNASMALLVSAIPIFGGLSAGGVTADVLAVAAMSFPYFCAQEILYNVEDVDDDRRAGLRTTAVRIGVRRSLLLTGSFLIVYAVMAIVPYAVGIAGVDYLVAIVGVSVLPGLAIAAWLAGAANPARIKTAVKATRAIWLPTVAALLLLK